jgi:hypothetical protein
MAKTPSPEVRAVARSATASNRVVAMPISFSRWGFRIAPASAVATPMVSTSTMATRPMSGVLRRCSSASAPSSTGITPSTSRELTPTPIAPAASSPVMGGPTSS